MSAEQRIEDAIKCLNELHFITINKFQLQCITDVLFGDLSYKEFCRLNEIEIGEKL